MKKIEQIWQQLGSEASNLTGLIYKRYDKNTNLSVFVAIKLPERRRCIAAHINSTTKYDLNKLSKFKEIEIQTYKDEKYPNKSFLLIVLLDDNHRDVFSTLCDDLLHKVANINNEVELIQCICSRIEMWRLLFEKINQQGLTSEEQLGLYGELYFLRSLLYNVPNLEYCVNTWKGAEKAIQDFQHSFWAVEIKTTKRKNHQKVFISSERQLDISYVPHLYLVHYSLDVREAHGETLNEIVKAIYELLENEPSAYGIFSTKLMQAGYFIVHSSLYNKYGYSIRRRYLYRVTDDFPKITEAQLPPGVGDVRYSIIVHKNEKWEVDENDLFQFLRRDIKNA